MNTEVNRQRAVFFCPGHISGYFNPEFSLDTASSGSRGGGIVIDSGVTVLAEPALQTTVTIQVEAGPGEFRTVSDDSPVIRHLLENLGVHVQVQTRCSLPLSSGYGLSAAALLATTHAINALYDLGLNDRQCACESHRVEVMFRTGLGDVAACQGGGWVIRRGPGVNAEILRQFDSCQIHALTLGPLKTNSVLTAPEMVSRISAAFPSGEPKSLTEFFTYSRRFAETSGLISDDVRKVLIACDANDIPASMTMLGNGVFALGEEAKSVLSRFGTVYTLGIAGSGPQMVEIVS